LRENSERDLFARLNFEFTKNSTAVNAGYDPEIIDDSGTIALCSLTSASPYIEENA